MTTKLTLTIEENVLNDANSFAQKTGRSLSDIVEGYLRILASGESGAEDLSPTAKRLFGAIKLPDDFDYKKTLEDELSKKYGK